VFVRRSAARWYLAAHRRFRSQALLVLRSCKGATYTALAAGFGVSATTV
jgi:hypothetical protein